MHASARCATTLPGEERGMARLLSNRGSENHTEK
jgi:hypothetical protein